jgi:hypothetical protein
MHICIYVYMYRIDAATCKGYIHIYTWVSTYTCIFMFHYLGAMARYYEVQGKYEYGCIDIYIYVCMGKYMFLYMYIYAYMYTCMKESRAMARYYEVQGRFICIWYICIYMYINTFIYMYIYIRILWVCILYTQVYKYMYIHIYINR